MKKRIAWCKDNILGIVTLFLLAFIPLYPKLPLVDIKNTWVYVRVEDFLVLGALAVWVTLLARKKITLDTPLTKPILVFWLIGVVATMHGVLLIFPTVANVFPNVAFLSLLRRIEYMSLFFIAFSSVRAPWMAGASSVVLMLTLLAASVYAIGQKYFSFPAYLTMNEEFAKGAPIQLSALSRVPSTFAGHYDFAAFLVLVIPVAVSLFFSVKSWFLKALLLVVSGLGLVAIFMTVSRISLVALIIALGVLLIAKNRRFLLYSIPVIVIGILVLIRFPPSIINRITSTVKEVDVLVDATNGAPIGKAKIVPNTYFAGKTIKQQFFRSTTDAKNTQAMGTQIVIPYTDLPPEVVLLTLPDAPTGEDLPEGTGYINLTLSPVVKKLNQFFYELKPTGSSSIEIQIINGPYLIKRTLAYDVSFTTRFQGEWPNAIAAFKKNILGGSGYGSVSLAVDNSYLRMLGEVGLAGFLSFAVIFVAAGIYIKKAWSSVTSTPVKSMTMGLVAGFFGLMVNALFIDVFEASKIAFVLWILIGIVLGSMGLYAKHEVNLGSAILRIVTTPVTVVIFLVVLTWVLYGNMTGNYFVGDDFTWLRWAAESKGSDFARYFTDAQGFFWRPGAKVYFALMYHMFWLNQTIYHIVSLILHSLVVVLTFFIARHIFKRTLYGALAAFLFMLISGYGEAVFWISATGFLFTTVLTLAGLLSFMNGKIWLALICSLLAPMFHELGIVVPILMLGYSITRPLKKSFNYLLLAPIPVYLTARFLANAHWFNGDYNYNLFKLPLNAVGNLFGYMLAALGGPMLSPLYSALRSGLKEHLFISLVVICVLAAAAVVLRKSIKFANSFDRSIVAFSVLFTVISLLPFLGLGNISPRYGYMASIGIVMLLVFGIQKIYANLATDGKVVAIAVVGLGIGIFILFQIIQLTVLHDNWHEAGEKVRKFIVSVDRAYEDHWSTSPMEFHFVDVPIKAGEAWVFPVGMSDSLWFIFQNPDVRIFQDAAVEDALAAVEYNSATQRVFVFNEVGQVSEIKKTPSDK